MGAVEKGFVLYTVPRIFELRYEGVTVSGRIVEIGSVSVQPGEEVFEYEHCGRSFSFELHPEVARPNTYSFLLLEHARVHPEDSILDVGTGTGFLAVTIAGTYKVRGVVATDINPLAVSVAHQNAILNGLQSQIQVREGSLYDPVEGERFDLIISQPRQTPTPVQVVETERRSKPHFYLNTSGGVDGWEFIRPLIAEAPEHLNDGGRLQLVVVDYLGTTRLMEIMSRYGLVPEVSAKLRTRLSPMTIARRSHIEEELQHVFDRDPEGKEYMHLLVLTGTKVAY